MAMHAIPARVCEACGSWPCRCNVEAGAPTPIEAPIRVERCACGGFVTVYGDQTPRAIMRAIQEHNRDLRHTLWRRPA